MRTVFKYAVPITDDIEIEMHKGATPLSFQEQHGAACVWALVDTEAPKTMRRFRLAGTGHTLDADDGTYVGTAQFRGGSLVFHLFVYPE